MARVAKNIWFCSVVLVCWLSVCPAPTSPLELSYVDKFGHAVAYTWLAFLPVGWIRNYRRLWWNAVFLLFLGGFLELIQGALPSRTMSAMDMVANLSGIAIGTLAARKVLEMMERNGRIMCKRN